jgi:predicted O-linked N-acetylglucosamine transferase (SPINDLY family)
MTVEAIEAGDLDSLGAELLEAKRRLGSGDQEGALALLAQLITNDSGNVPARFLLGLTAWKMGRLDWSLALTRECHESRPMDGAIAEVLASLYAQAGDLQESLFMGKLATALKAQGPLLELVPPEFPSFDWAFQNIKENPKLAAAEMSLADGMIELAVENARQHAALNPKDDAAQAFFAALLLRTGAAGKAVEVLRRTENADDVSASQASLYGRALAAVGDIEAARHWHDEAIALAPENRDIAAARVADGLWLERDRERLATVGNAWVRRFCPPKKPSQWTPVGDKLMIGYIVSAFADPQDAAHIAAVARGHDRANTMVVGYGIGAQSWHQNLPFQGAFDLWQDISALDSDALALFFERDGLHAIIDLAGFAAPMNMLALARVQTAIRVAWLGNEGRVAEPIYDAQLVATSADGVAPPLWPIAGGYPVPRARAEPRKSLTGRAVQFGADVVMAQIDAETARLWSAVLRQQPDAKLLLRSHDMTFPANIDRLVAMFGRDLAARIDIVNDGDAGDFYSRVDVALTPSKGVSPRMAAEALACGVAPVALGGAGLGKVYASFLEGVGVGSALVAHDPQDYVKRAVRLGASPEPRKEALATLSASPWAGEQGIARFARALEDHARRALNSAKALAS